MLGNVHLGTSATLGIVGGLRYQKRDKSWLDALIHLGNQVPISWYGY